MIDDSYDNAGTPQPEGNFRWFYAQPVTVLVIVILVFFIAAATIDPVTAVCFCGAMLRFATAAYGGGGQASS